MRAHVLVLLLLATALAGCGDSKTPSGMFAGADHRWAGSSPSAFEEANTLVLAAGTHTLHIAAESERGFAIALIGPDGEGYGFTHSWHVNIARLDYHIASELTGAWSLSYGCDGPCEYAIAIDEGDALPRNPAPQFADAATAFVAGELDADDERHVVEVPAGNVTIRTHVQSDDGMRWIVRDGGGNLVTQWNFDGIHARDWRYGPSDPDTTPGDWHVDVVCDGACSYNFGIIVQ